MAGVESNGKMYCGGNDLLLAHYYYPPQGITLSSLTSPPRRPSIWEEDPHPPPKIGSPILTLLFNEMKDMIDEGGVNISPLRGEFAADVTDLTAVCFVLETLQILLKAAEEDHYKLIYELCTSYLDDNNHFHKVTWLTMCGQTVDKGFYNRYILDAETTKTFHKVHQARQILQTTIENFLPLIREWSALYRNGEALKELNLIHILLKDFRKKVFKWSLIAQALRVECNLGKRPYSPKTIKKKQKVMFVYAGELAKLADPTTKEESEPTEIQPMEIEAESEISTISPSYSTPITCNSDTSFRNSFSSDGSNLSSDLNKLSLT